MPENALEGLNWLAIAIAAFAPFMLGGIWYGPLFGKAWMRASGISEEKAKQANMPVVFGVSFLLQIVQALVLAMFIGTEANLSFGLFAGLSAGAFWVATGFGVVYLFEQRPIPHFLINGGYQVVSFTLMGVILGAM